MSKQSSNWNPIPAEEYAALLQALRDTRITPGTVDRVKAILDRLDRIEKEISE
jgi:hypothetical protein